MSTDLRQLTNPESLSVCTLLQILKSRCIEVPDIKTLKKSDLVEMFRRVAMPMPQRRYNEAKHLGKKLNDLRLARKISIATEEDQTLYRSAITSQNNTANKSDSGRLKPSFDDVNSLPKKMCLANSSSGTNGLPENSFKRKNEDTQDSAQKEARKRQKITWP